MKKRALKNRITAVILTALMTVSMTGYAFADAFALGQDEEEKQSEAVTEGIAEEPSEAEGLQQSPETDNPEEGEDDPEETAERGILSMQAAAEISLFVKENKNRIIEVSWTAADGADYYVLSLDSAITIDSRTSDGALDGMAYVFKNVDPKTPHSVTIRAYRERTEADGEGEGDILVGEAAQTGICAYVDGATNRKAVGSTGRNAVRLNINLKTLLGESRSGYSVVQGGASDGTYAYYLMVSSGNQKGRILKTRISDNAVMARSAVINICHGNGMALDTRRNRLVVVGRDDRRNQLTIIKVGTDAASVPVFEKYVNVNYSYSSNWTGSKSTFDGYGLSAISYVEKYDCFVALQRSTHELLVLDPDFRVIGTIHTTITAKYPGTYQAMDADERYVYLLLSYYNSSQPYNVILALDWHGDKVADIANGKAAYVKKAWTCGSNGTPSAVIRTNTPYEAENIYHVYDSNSGTSRVYLSEYYNNPSYHWVTKKKAYKKKWKKVTKRVKWKKVKKNGKWKWKYKKKKVWKYKKKYKKVKVKVVDYYNREGYVYDLGTF